MNIAPPHPPSLTGDGTGRSLLPGWVLWLHRNRHVTVPLGVAPVFAAAAAAASAAHVGAYTATGAAILAVTVWVFAPHKWDRKAEVWYALLSAIVAGSWLTATAFAGLTWWSATPLVMLVIV